MVIIWAFVYTLIPCGLFFLLINDFFPPLILGVFCFACPGSLIFGSGYLLRRLRVVHQISFTRTFLVFLLGALLQAPFIIGTFYFVIAFFRPLFTALAVFSVQIITTTTVIAIGVKILKYCAKNWLNINVVAESKKEVKK